MSVENVISEMLAHSQRFTNPNVNPDTGKPKDPKRRLIARRAAQRHASDREAAARKNASSRASLLVVYGNVGKLVAKISRRRVS